MALPLETAYIPTIMQIFAGVVSLCAREQVRIPTKPSLCSDQISATGQDTFQYQSQHIIHFDLQAVVRQIGRQARQAVYTGVRAFNAVCW